MDLRKLGLIASSLAVVAGCTPAPGTPTPGGSTSPAPGSSAAPAATSSAAPAPGSSGLPSAQPAAGKQLTEADVKAHVMKFENSLLDSGGTSHTKVDVTFHTITFGAPRPANMQDRFDGAKGDTLYPVNVKYTSFRTWGSGETRTIETNYRYEFYIDSFGAWDALGLGPVN